MFGAWQLDRGRAWLLMPAHRLTDSLAYFPIFCYHRASPPVDRGARDGAVQDARRGFTNRRFRMTPHPSRTNQLRPAAPTERRRPVAGARPAARAAPARSHANRGPLRRARCSGRRDGRATRAGLAPPRGRQLPNEPKSQANPRLARRAGERAARGERASDRHPPIYRTNPKAAQRLGLGPESRDSRPAAHFRGPGRARCSARRDDRARRQGLAPPRGRQLPNEPKARPEPGVEGQKPRFASGGAFSRTGRPRARPMASRAGARPPRTRCPSSSTGRKHPSDLCRIID
jgi:hypothetical protein